MRLRSESTQAKEYAMRLLPFAVLVASGCASAELPPAPPVPPWPTSEEVAHVRAEVFAGPYQQSAVPEFELPAEYATAVVRMLTPHKYYDLRRSRESLRVVGRL